MTTADYLMEEVLAHQSADVLELLREKTDEIVAEMAAEDPLIARISESFTAFREASDDWQRISEQALLETRG